MSVIWDSLQMYPKKIKITQDSNNHNSLLRWATLDGYGKMKKVLSSLNMIGTKFSFWVKKIKRENNIQF